MSRKSRATAPSTAAEMPAWFDPAKHLLTDNGVMERRTGIWLAADGLPLDGPRRAAALAAADPETAVVTAEDQES